MGVVEIDSSDGPVALWVGWLLDDLHNAIALQLRHAVGLGIFHLGKQNLSALPLMAEALRGVADRILQNVVAQNQANRIARREMLGQAQRLRDAARAILIGIVQLFEAKLAAISK